METDSDIKKEEPIFPDRHFLPIEELINKHIILENKLTVLTGLLIISLVFNLLLIVI